MARLPDLDEGYLINLFSSEQAAPHPRWWERAACLDSPLSPDAYFPDDNSRPPDAALDCCASCPVATLCLADALAHEREDGIRNGWWGGLGPDERDELERRLRSDRSLVGLDAVTNADRARALRGEHKTITSIAAELGCTERTVYRYLSSAA